MFHSWITLWIRKKSRVGLRLWYLKRKGRWFLYSKVNNADWTRKEALKERISLLWDKMTFFKKISTCPVLIFLNILMKIKFWTWRFRKKHKIENIQNAYITTNKFTWNLHKMINQNTGCQKKGNSVDLNKCTNFYHFWRNDNLLLILSKHTSQYFFFCIGQSSKFHFYW